MGVSGSTRFSQQLSSARYGVIIGLMTCFVLGILISTFYTLHRLHADAIKAHFDLGAMYARTFEEHLTQSSSFIDRTLAVQIDEITSGKPPEQRGQSFTASLRQMPYLRSLSLIDSAGIVIASSNPLNRGIKVTGDYLPATTQSADVLRIGRPWSGRDFSNGQERADSAPVTPDELGFIPLLRMFDHNGAPHGLVATLNPDYFINYYRQMLGYAEDQVELLRYDGTALLYTGERGSLGDIARTRAFIAGLGETESGKFEDEEPGQSPRLVSYRTSRHFPLVVVTQMDRNRALEQWKEERRRLLLVVVPSLALVVSASLLLYRRQQRIQIERIESERREYEKFAATVFATVAEAVLATDAESRIVLVNPALSRVTGYSEDELIGKTPALFSSGRHEAAFFRQMWSALKQSGYWEGEIHNRRKDGRPWIVWTSISRVCDADGRVTHYVAGYTDVTERKQMEESLRLAKEEAESATNAKSAFLASMSHEIRTPMNGVIGMTDVLLDTGLNEEQRQYAEIVRKSGENLLEIVNDILDFSKIEAHRLTLEETPFDLRSTLEDTLELLAGRAHTKGLEIIGLLDPTLPRQISGDPGRLRQILMNLAGNAIKFTENGEVSVRASLLASDNETVQIGFQVKDTGIGIPADRIEAIFEPFTQADDSTTRKFGGTGLGLAICKQLCQLMGGEIGAESETGKGSTFRFSARFTIVPEPAEQTPRFAPLEDVKILVVDNNETSRQLLTDLLSGWGCRCAAADGGPGALELLREAQAAGEPFSIALLDQNMPGMDGFSLATQIHKEPTHAGTLLVMLTFIGKRCDGAAMQSAGLSDCLTKPIRQQQLYDCLALLKGRRFGGFSAATGYPAAGQSIDKTSRSSARILLAEDNQVNQVVALALLKKLGYRADVAANGLEALDALSRIPYDLILMDCQMPQMDGFEATAAIRNPASKVLDHSVPIIAMTANALQGDHDRCIKAGMNDYLVKPVTQERLKKIIGKWLNNTEDTPEQRMEECTAVQTPPAPPETFDPSWLQNQLGSVSIMKEILEIAIEDIPERIEQLSASLKEGDQAGVQQYVHTLKGITGNIAAGALRSTAIRIENALGKNDPQETGRLLLQARAQAAELISALEQWKAEH